MAKRILVVDDEPSICHMLGHVLTDERYQVETAGNVLDALAKLAATSFDLAIVDLFLPDTNGLNLAEAIRMLDPKTPVILITAYGTPSFESMASHPAIAHYMHKPFSLERLLGLVHRILPPPSGSKPSGMDAIEH